MKLLLTLTIVMTASGTRVLAAAEPAEAGPAPARRELLIEAAIIEVAADRSKALDLHPAVPIPFALDAVKHAGSVERKGFGYAGRVNHDLDSMLRALSRQQRVKILQRPRIQTADGVPASLFVGQSLPGLRHAGTEPGSTNAAAPLLTGVTLEVAPTIKADQTVVLDLHLRVDRSAGNQMVPGVGLVPVTSSTDAQAKIAVRDHETILLGGLRHEGGKAAAPVLAFPKELPVPSAIDSRASARDRRSELLVLIRPPLLAGSGAR